MSYIGNVPTTAAFPFDQFSGTGAQVAFTLSQAPASTTSIAVTVSGVVQNPNTYSVSGTTLTFTEAPPTGTDNIGVLFLGLPAIVGIPSDGVVTPAMLSTGGPSWTAGGVLSLAGPIKSSTTSPPEIQNSAGTQIGTFCRAWVNFNGIGTVAIRAAFNVSSITDNAVGVYTVHFSTAMPDANYNAVGSVRRNATDSNLDFSLGQGGYAYSNNAFSLATRLSTSVTFEDALIVNVSVFR